MPMLAGSSGETGRARVSAPDRRDEVSEWQPINTAPDKRYGESPEDVFLAGPAVGVCSGRACRYPDGYVFAGVAHISGNLAVDGGVTHWMPRPDPPQARP